METDEISGIVIDEAIGIHRELGLLLNFSGATMKEGIRRIVNNHIAI